jgi:membrane protein required for colicin V production
MNVFDIVIVVLLVLGFIRGIMNGLFVEIASLVGVVAGVFVAIHYSNYLETYLGNATFVDWSAQTNKIVAFVVTFLVVVLLILLIGKILTKIADIAALGMLNKVLGGVFGVLKIALILSIIFIFFNQVNNTIPFIKKETLEASMLYNPIKKIVPELFPSIMKEDKDGKTVLELPK